MQCILLTIQNTILAVDILHTRGLINKMCPRLQLKKTKVRLCKSFIYQQKVLYGLYITNKMERCNFKSEFVVQVVKHLKEDWLVLH